MKQKGPADRTMALHLLDHYDAILADLDGTVFEGGRPVPGAAEGLNGRRVVYVTNNASRSPEQVAEHLNHLGFPADADSVLTSAQAACTLASRELEQRGISPQGAKAFVIGAESFKELARRESFRVVESADDEPAIVLQGHSPDNDWARLSEGALAIRRGAVYVASNLDTTLPSERGLLVGNGSMVAAVSTATGQRPVSAGKPGPAMFHVAAQRLGSTHPLVVGDRLDTDIAGGNAAGFDTLCTVTGVSGHWDVLYSSGLNRPNFIAANMRDHLPGWSATVTEGGAADGADGLQVTVRAGEEGPVDVMAAEALAAAAPLVWKHLDASGSADSRPEVAVVGGDDLARRAVEAWR